MRVDVIAVKVIASAFVLFFMLGSAILPLMNISEMSRGRAFAVMPLASKGLWINKSDNPVLYWFVFLVSFALMPSFAVLIVPPWIKLLTVHVHQLPR